MHACDRCCACFKGFTLACLLSACPAFCSHKHGHGGHCGNGNCRHLAEAAEEPTTTTFVEWLDGESPVDHIKELHESANSGYDVIEWLMMSIGEAGSEVAHAEEEEDEHAGHDHRRLAQVASAPDEAAEEVHDHAEDEHDHSEEEHDEEEHEEDEHSEEEHDEEEHSEEEHDEDEHSEVEHDHEEHDEEVATMLRVADLRAMTTNSSNLEATTDVASALQYITACTLDSRCSLETAAMLLEEEEEEASKGRLLGFKAGLALAFVGMTVIASFVPVTARRTVHFLGILSCLNTFSGAIFLTVGLTHLLPHVNEFQELSMPEETYPVGLTFVALGFLLVLFVEQILFDAHGSRPEHEVAEKERSNYALLDRTLSIGLIYCDPLLTQLAVTVHAVLECMVMGLASTEHDVLLLFAAIASHKVFSTISLSTRFLRLGASPGLLFVLMMPFHLLAPLAVIVGALIGEENFTVSLVLTGLSTGTFLYIGAFEVVCEEFAEHVDPATVCEADCPIEGSAHAGICPAKVECGIATNTGWLPTKRTKFLMFLLGTGVIMAVTAALPKDAHNH